MVLYYMHIALICLQRAEYCSLSASTSFHEEKKREIIEKHVNHNAP